MRWIQPNKTIDPKDIRKHTIRPGSVLDIPRAVLVHVRNFEEELTDHFKQQKENNGQSHKDCELILAMLPIYQIYKREGAVEIISTHGKYVKHRHEKVVIDLIKENAVHLDHLCSYFKAA